ncbi:Cryptochrome/photolyase FAD-binding domain-containing protein [Pseudovirgaria hyperparasitica]|uniref:Cryptochrome/photolyase FAD-binding domain-containing protein n=1 Tax=Pseudovirgaria hyperparasitica TaxID=470096 RepID=A0A6A6W5U0_9PEZI|nr:Cryptochrome/photolyase FAD-binding domain-containing protein [Pseudovirgaria hyperparasitica]KAF2757915.1 Cryptochrome/photolyase FAD-binding domain-containing protein [Pseudovirgaria hyperparasitica]
MPSPRVIYWFRTDLRLHDSPALQAALDLEPECLFPVWCWDPHYVYRARVGVNRWQFLIDCQNDVSKSITKINPNSKLFVVREAPQTVLPKLWKKWRITHIVFEKDTDAYARDRDEAVRELARKAGVEVIVRMGRTLYDPDELVRENGGKPTMSITQVQNAGKKLTIPRPIPAPTSLPDPGDTDLSGIEPEPPAANPDLNAAHRNNPDTTYHALAGPAGTFAVPTLDELGLPPATTPHRGGEQTALTALAAILTDKTYTATFEKPKTAPTAFSPQSTTLLSPHLHFGSLSAREFYWRVQDILSAFKHSKPSRPPTSLTGQLLFRDMYFGAQAALGHPFSQSISNPSCRFIPWHLPSTLDPTTARPTTGRYTIDHPAAETWFKRWKAGLTGYPFIDALMRQLRTEGWIHHLGRHAVACFLTRGGAYVAWERGAEVFEEWLLDHETACNAGNWQWVACAAFSGAQYYRVYSPVAFGRKWDAEGVFVRRYVPELARFDRRFVYEPWRAPVADQKRWGCRVLGDGRGGAGGRVKEGEGEYLVYPKPMFDFGERREVCVRGLKSAFAAGLYGADESVVDGSWRGRFDDAGEGPTEGSEGLPLGMAEGEEGDVDVDWEGMSLVVHDGGEGEEDVAPKGVKHQREKSQSSLDSHVKRSKK